MAGKAVSAVSPTAASKIAALNSQVEGLKVKQTRSQGQLLKLEGAKKDVETRLKNAKVKIAVLGNGKVGKTSLCQCLREGRIPGTYDLTVGVDITTKDVKIAGNEVRLILWDMAGQDQ